MSRNKTKTRRNDMNVHLVKHLKRTLPTIKEVVREFKMLHHEWEGDSTGYVVLMEDGSIQLAISDHGAFYLDNNGVDTKAKMEEYKALIQATQEAVNLITK